MKRCLIGVSKVWKSNYQLFRTYRLLCSFSQSLRHIFTMIESHFEGPLCALTMCGDGFGHFLRLNIKQNLPTCFQSCFNFDSVITKYVVTLTLSGFEFSQLQGENQLVHAHNGTQSHQGIHRREDVRLCRFTVSTIAQRSRIDRDGNRTNSDNNSILCQPLDLAEHQRPNTGVSNMHFLLFTVRIVALQKHFAASRNQRRPLP